ncbi:MAG: RecQ family ATP-dependent DNA helicase [Spirochaetes bacterium]|nr:RecQ family ATP-dependent DNA helicase [Spirochaetota bacterium]
MEEIPWNEALPDPILEVGNRFFGIRYLFPYQRLAIHNILYSCGYFGKVEDSFGDQIVLLPTGAGKSLCFQLPAVLLSGLTLVVYPLLSLMADQYRRLQEARISVGLLKGGQSPEERESLFRSLQEEELKILLTNPEALANPRTLTALAQLSITHFVVDEAHCIAQWGETFRPSYLNLGKIRTTLKPKVTTAFTATASPVVLEKIREHLFNRTLPHEISANPDRPNIEYSVIETLSKQRTLRTLLAPIGKEQVQRPALIFCRSRKRAEQLALSLRRSLWEKDIFFYHAGLSHEEKKRIENWFFHSTTGILTATTAYGMGVDKSNIRTVIHDQAPETLEAYLQESGRGGRDTKPCQAILLVSEEDRWKLSPFFRGYVTERGCRRTYLYRGLGMELDGCSGCDTCNQIVHRIEGYDTFVSFFRRNSRRYTEEEVIHLLGGKPSLLSVTNALHRNRWYGVLGEWEPEELEEGLENLFRLGYIRRGKFLWKNRLFLNL